MTLVDYRQDPDYLASAKSRLLTRIETAKSMCKAVEAWLTLDSEMELADVVNAQNQPKQPQFTTTDLIRASDQVNTFSQQLNEMDNASAHLDELPDGMKGLMVGQIGFLRSIISQQLQSALDYLKCVQQDLEGVVEP